MQILSKETALAELARQRESLLAGRADCIMCALAEGGGAPAPLVQSEHAVVLLDRFACRYGHLMVVARRHVERVGELEWELFSDVHRSCSKPRTRWMPPCVRRGSLPPASGRPSSYP